jgi:hypothetical protein
MPFTYTKELINTALPYPEYRSQIREKLAFPPAGVTAKRMRPHLANNTLLMDR